MEIPVIVKNVIYKGNDGFAVLGCSLDILSAKYKKEMDKLILSSFDKKYKTFPVVVNNFTDETPNGGQYIFVGDFIFNAKQGSDQFKAEFYYQDLPTTESGLKAFLMSLPNIKENRSQAIIKKFGIQGTIDVLDNSPYDLVQINGLNEKRIPSIIEAWQDKKHMRELFIFFTEHNVSVALAEKIFKKWGKLSLAVIKENPYKLVEIYGIGFVTADQIAHKIMENVPFQHRIKACIQFIIEDSVWTKSNLCLPFVDLKKEVLSLIEKCNLQLNKHTEKAKTVETIISCLKSNSKDFCAIKDTTENIIYIYLKTIFEKEKFIAQQIWERTLLKHQTYKCSEEDIQNAEHNISNYNNKTICLDISQKMAIKSAFENKMTIITGGGGTGKSTICRAIYYLAKKKNLSVRMMSPTGKAAQVLTEKTGCQASTIHRSLNIKLGQDHPNNSIVENIIIIDEVSMSGIDTIYPILLAAKENTSANIVLVGDKNQLPSVSPGNFLSDMISCGLLNVVVLDKVHRQDQKSYIPLLAENISKGKNVKIPQDASDIKWKSVNSSSFDQDITSFINEYISSGQNLNDLQIISPMKKGLCGVYKINAIVQKQIAEKNNKESLFVEANGNKFHVGDKVIQIVNNYQKNIFNGDMGIVTDVGIRAKDETVNDTKEKFITVNFSGQNILYFGDDLNELQLAWGITVHKFQGSQSKNIVFVMSSEAYIMMNKELVYTAFTRAEKMLTIFGDRSMLDIAPTKSSVKKRYTNFVKFIDEYKNNRKVFNIIC